MKLLVFLCAALAFASGSPLFADPASSGAPPELEEAQNLVWTEVPLSVQKTLTAHAGPAVISAVQRGIIHGQRVYRGTFWQETVPVELFVTEEGSLYALENNVGWNELPLAVQEAYSSVNNLAGLQSVTRQNKNGQTVYEFRSNNLGQQSWVQFAEDGQIVNARTQPASLLGAAAIAWEDLPLPVRSAVRTQADSAPMDEIKQGQNGDQTIYEVTFRRAGQREQMHVSQSGQILNRGSTIAEASGSDKGATSLNFFDLPLAVQKTVNELTSPAPIHQVTRQTIDQQPFYEITILQGGQLVPIRVSAEGVVVE